MKTRLTAQERLAKAQQSFNRAFREYETMHNPTEADWEAFRRADRALTKAQLEAQATGNIKPANLNDLVRNTSW